MTAKTTKTAKPSKGAAPAADKPSASFVSLKQMAEGHLEGVQKQTTFKADPRLLCVEAGFNKRFHNKGWREHIDRMKAAMRGGATFPPIDVHVRDGKIYIVDGHCRNFAYLERIEEGDEIDLVDVRQFRGSDADRAAHVLTSSQGKALAPLEQGIGYLHQMTAFGWSIEKLSERTGRSDTHIKGMLMLAEADKAIQDMLINEQVSAEVVMDVLRKHGNGTTALEILQGGLERARAAGKSKVTAKTFSGPRVPPRVVTSVLSSVDAVVDRLDKATRVQLAEFENLEPSQLEGKKVEIDAAALLELVKAHGTVAEIRAKQASAAQEAQAKAAQQDLTDVGSGHQDEQKAA